MNSAERTEAEIDAVVEEFGGDLRAAIRALLHDLAVLTLDRTLTVSRGYVRGRWLTTPDAAPTGVDSIDPVKARSER